MRQRRGRSQLERFGDSAPDRSGLAGGQLPSTYPGHSAVVYVIAAATTAVLLLASLLAHELAHAAVARRNGVEVQSIPRRPTRWTCRHPTAARPPPTRRRKVALDARSPSLTVNGMIKTEPGKGTYRKPSPKSDASVRTVVLPDFAVTVLQRRRAAQPENPNEAVFPTRNGTRQPVNNVERRRRQIRELVLDPTQRYQPIPKRDNKS